MHNRVNMGLVTYMVLAISANECMTFQQKQGTYSSDLHVRQILQRSSDIQPTDSNEKVDLGENATGPSTESSIHSTWPLVLGAVIAVLSIVLLIAVAVKYHLFKCCLPRNSHDLLLDGDAASQFSQTRALEEGVPKRGMRGRMIHTGGDSSSEDNDDDDGFIEDNYIQASERERAKQEETHQAVVETDDELIVV